MGRHIFGNIESIDTSSDFARLRRSNSFYVDKTGFIEHFLSDQTQVSLICRPRRFGKSLNMDTLRRFLTDAEDNRGLFVGLAVEKSPVWDQANSAPVFYFDFKGLLLSDYRYRIYAQVLSHIFSYYEQLKDGATKRIVQAYLDNRDAEAEGLSLLTRAVYEVTGKMSYILVDEYDSLLMQAMGTDKYVEVRDYVTALFSSVFKGNPHLAKGLLTGVMRVSFEGLFSGLNNIVVFDVFRDQRYDRDFGITEDEMQELQELQELQESQELPVVGLRDWYNGFRINGEHLYNTYSVVRYLCTLEFDVHWGNSGTLDLVANALNMGRSLTLDRLMDGEQMQVPANQLASLAKLNDDDAAFYSVLIQSGYLAYLGGGLGRCQCLYSQSGDVAYLARFHIQDGKGQRKLHI